MLDLEKWGKVAIRLLAAGLCLLSFQKAWAGLWFYEGQRAFKQENFREAARDFQKSLKGDRTEPHTLYFLGQSAWHLGVQRKEKVWLETAELFLKQFTREIPDYGRAWLYLALVRLALEQQSADKVTVAEWKKEIQPLFEAAYRREPASAWINFMTGKALLSYSPFLSEGERKRAFERIKKSTALHYPDQPSPYLRPALSFLWNQFSDFGLLKEITPRDTYSYYPLIEFAEQKGLRAQRDEVYPEFLRVTQEAYESQCLKAQRYLEKGFTRRAFVEFQKAFWIDKKALRAKTGMLIAQEKMNRFRGRP